MKIKTGVILAIITVITLALLPKAFAGEGTTGDYLGEIGTKFGRGLVNVVSSPAEIPCTMRDDMKVQPASGAVTGFGKGIAFMLRRILVGVTEVGTFMIPMPATIPTVCKAPSTSTQA